MERKREGYLLAFSCFLSLFSEGRNGSTVVILYFSEIYWKQQVSVFSENLGSNLLLPLLAEKSLCFAEKHLNKNFFQRAFSCYLLLPLLAKFSLNTPQQKASEKKSPTVSVFLPKVSYANF
jgi:hypothetical protein